MAQSIKCVREIPFTNEIARKKYKLWLIYLYHLDLTLLTVLFLSVFLHPLHP